MSSNWKCFKHTHKSGFTLLEVLVAGLISTLLLGVIFSFYSSSLKNYRKAKTHADVAKQINLLYLVTNKNVSNLVPKLQNGLVSFDGRPEGFSFFSSHSDSRGTSFRRFEFSNEIDGLNIEVFPGSQSDESQALLSHSIEDCEDIIIMYFDPNSAEWLPSWQNQRGFPALIWVNFKHSVLKKSTDLCFEVFNGKII